MFFNTLLFLCEPPGSRTKTPFEFKRKKERKIRKKDKKKKDLK